MNKWQKYYRDKYYNGKEPRDKIGKMEFAALAPIKDYVIVNFPEIKKNYRCCSSIHTRI